MRKLFIVLAILFGIIAIVFAILPLGTLGFIPISFSLLFIVLAYTKSNDDEKKLPKWLFAIIWITLIITVIKSLIPDKVVLDKQFEQKKEASKKEDMKDLEDLEKDLK